jgi:hypothetical protein
MDLPARPDSALLSPEDRCGGTAWWTYELVLEGYIPTAVFDIDIRPSAARPTQINQGMGVPTASF